MFGIDNLSIFVPLDISETYFLSYVPSHVPHINKMTVKHCKSA